MPSIFTNSMSNDGVDRFNFKWMVLLMLVLSLVSFIIPLHPSYQDQDGEWQSVGLTTTQPTKKKASRIPEVDVACWCPVEFTYTYVEYANTFCGNAFNSEIRGIKTDSVFSLVETPIPLSMQGRGDFSIHEALKDFRENVNKEEERNEETEKIKSRLQKLSTFRTPITLLVLGVCLILPQAIWVFLSESLSCFNVGQTLETVQGAEGLDAARIFEDVSNSVKSSSKMSGVLYLLKKTLAVIVAIGLLIVISQHASPQVEQLETDLDTNSSELHSLKSQASGSATNGSSETNILSRYLNSDAFVCAFGIRQLQNIQRWTVQCTITNVRQEDETVHHELILPSNPNPSLETSNLKNLLEFESTMLKIVTAFLVILVVANIFSLCVWISKLLTTSARNALGLSSSTALDIVFLVQMAQVNTSVSTTNRLARTLASGRYTKSEKSETT